MWPEGIWSFIVLLMSKKHIFTEKIVTLQLPGCRPVSFDPLNCEWTAMSSEEL